MTAELPPLARLALAYAPSGARPDWLTFLTLDARLAGVVRQAREPILAQMRLAWWRDRFTADPAGWPGGEPLLRDLSGWGQHVRALGALVDGWEGLLGEAPLDEAVLESFAAGRVAALAALMGQLGTPDPGAAALARRWALADLALHLGNPAERAGAVRLLDRAPAGRTSSRALRPLAVLAGLSERAVRRGANEALDGPRALLVAIRLGIFGG